MVDALRDEGAAAITVLPKKRSLFSKATLAQATETEDAVDFFSRAKELQPLLLAEEQRRREKKKIVKSDRKRSTISAERQERNLSEGKKRRVSGQAQRPPSGSEDGRDAPDTPQSRRDSTNSASDARKSKLSPTPSKAQASPTTLSSRYTRDLNLEKQRTKRSDVVVLSDSEEDDTKTTENVRQYENAPIVIEDGRDYLASHRKEISVQDVEEQQQQEEEEFPELVAKARERERLRALQKSNATRSFENHNHVSKAGIPDIDDIFQEETTATELDPTIEILITSKLEGTKPLLVRRKLSQKLQPVRTAWCDHQHFAGHDLTREIFLTWKNKRLFDSNTSAGLGLKFDQRGNLLSEGSGIESQNRVHLEAWTDDVFANFQKVLAVKKRKQQGFADEEDAVEETTQEAEKVKLLLKAKDMEPFRLAVNPDTPITKIITAFRQARSVPDTKEIALFFDGDKFDPETTVGETELADMDTVDVHIR